MKRFLNISFCLLAFFYSCNKPDNDPAKPKDKECKVISAELINDLYVGKADITYDTENNIKKIESSQDSAFTSFSVVSANDKIKLDTKYWGEWIYYLDDRKRTTKVVAFVNNYYPNGAYIATFSYDTNGYITSTVVEEQAYFTTTYNFFYTDGNITKITGLDSKTNTEKLITFTYDSNNDDIVLINRANPLYYIGLPEVLPGFFGKVTEKMLLSVRETSNLKGNKNGDYTETNLTYAKDADGNTITLDVKSTYGTFSEGSPNYVKGNWYSQYKFKYLCN